MDFFSAAIGAFVLWVCQGIYRIGREHGAISPATDAKNAEYLHNVIRQAPREPRADITAALKQHWWN